MDAPCGWNVDPSGVCSDWSEYEPGTQDAAIDIASRVVWASTGRRFGACPVTVRPCQDKVTMQLYRVYPVTPTGHTGDVSFPFIRDGVWRNTGCCGPLCCCQPECEIQLDGPVGTVTEVTVDGSVVDPDAYRVDVSHGSHRLVRVDGDCWPTCQDFDALADADGAFTVTYERGIPVPADVLTATGLLACQYAKDISNGGACKIPQRVTGISRQGVDIDVQPAEPGAGWTGIVIVDQIIHAHNPSRRQRPPVLVSPDSTRAGDRYTTQHPGGS